MMSSNLVWEPVHRKTGDLSTELKFALRTRYGNPVNVVLDCEDYSYLLGLHHGGIEDAKILIDAVEKHKQIEVREVF